MKKKLNGYYNYTVVLTYLGMISGFSGIAFVLEGRIRPALICLMIAGIFDMFDGAVASTRNRTESEKRFGIQIDSLSDLICFGVLPALITYCLCRKSPLSFVVGGLYALCALIRLAYFNVMEEERQSQEIGRRSRYDGLPVTSSALLFPAFFIVGQLAPISEPTVILIATGAMAAAFVLPFPVRKPHLLGQILMTLMGLLVLAALFLVGSPV